MLDIPPAPNSGGLVFAGDLPAFIRRPVQLVILVVTAPSLLGLKSPVLVIRIRGRSTAGFAIGDRAD
jgi:hypothetical protein